MTDKPAPSPRTAALHGAPGSEPPHAARREEAQPTRLRRLMALGAELTVSVVAALLFFFVFLGGLAVIMPSGVTIRSVVGTASYSGSGEGDQERTMTGSLDGLTGLEPGTTATLRVLNNEVKKKGTSEIAWSSVHSGSALRDGDAVQTTHEGTALLRFAQGEEFQLGQNSLMVVRATHERPAASTVRSSVLVLDGDLWAGVAHGSEEEKQVSVATPTATVEVGASAGASAGSRIKVSVGPDKTSTISVYGGVADLVAGGKRVRMKANEFVNVDSASVMTAPAPLPDPPGLIAPAREAFYDFRELSPQVRFEWTPVAGAESYRLVLSRTPDFRHVVLDRRMSGTGFAFGNFEEGDYWWRVSVFRAGAEGPPSATRTLQIAKRSNAPALEVTFPADVVAGDECTIAGVTEPGNRVFVAGESVQPAASGHFEHRVRLKRGFNVLVVETIDRVGNTAYRSKVVEAKF